MTATGECNVIGRGGSIYTVSACSSQVPLDTPGRVEVRLETLGHGPDAVLFLHDGEIAQLAHRLQNRVVKLDHGRQAFDRLLQLDLSARDPEHRCVGGKGQR